MFIPVTGSPNIPTATSWHYDENSTLNLGDLIYADTTDSKLIPAVASTTFTNLVGIAKTYIAAATGSTVEIEYIPVTSQMEVIADCTSNTADGHLYKYHLLTNSSTVANTTTTITTSAGIFFATGAVGAASNKKLRGYLIKTGHFE